MNLIIKGFIIGLGKILPGVSGAMLSISLGIYEQIIESISNLRKNIIKNSKFLSKVGLGIILSITLTSKIIVKCINTCYLPTMLLFIGMILGGLPNLIKITPIKKLHITVISIIMILLFITLKDINIINNHIIEYTIFEILKLIGIGIIDAISSIVPGISGTAILMMLGYYNVILDSFATILDITKINHNIFILIPFGIGFIIGTILISKIICMIIKKRKNIINLIVIVFTIFTTIFLLKKTLTTNFTCIQLIIGIILFMIGMKISIYLDNKNT